MPILWALMTGFITGGIWVAIVLIQRQDSLKGKQEHLLNEVDRQQRELDAVYGRLAELEERMDFTERVISASSKPQHRPPPYT